MKTLEEIKQMRVCPGCGKVNPVSLQDDYFACVDCDWEDNTTPSNKITTVGEMMVSDQWENNNNVNLKAFLSAILS